jgi:RimJ/RimL family protein N-acetyltransferase
MPPCQLVVGMADRPYEYDEHAKSEYMRDALQPEIQSERLILRAWRPSDAEALFALFNNWEVIDDARSYIDGAIHRSSEDAEESYAVTLQAEVVGAIGVRLRPASHLQRAAGPNFGYWIGQPYWGRGYMTEAVRALARAVFGRGPHDAIFSGAFTDNAASLRVQEKTGFVRDGDTMLHARPRGSDFPHINTALTRSRFESLSS